MTLKSASLKKPHFLVPYLTSFYLLSSFLVTGVVFAVCFYSSSVPTAQLFTLSMLLVGSYDVWEKTSGREEFFAQTSLYPLFFLFQVFGWVGTAFETQRFELMYFAFIPCFYAVFYTAFFNGRPERKRVQKGATLFVLLFTFYAFVSGVTDIQLGRYEGIALFSLFGVWSGYLIYNVIRGYNRQRWMQLKERFQRQSHFRVPEKKLFDEADQSAEYLENRERYFVHDIVNHTHGLNLFLSNRVAQQKGLGPDEVRSLIAEVKTFQSMIRDYYQQSHKNLVNTYDWVAFRFARRALRQLVDSFLPSQTVQTVIEYHGDLDPEGRLGSSPEWKREHTEPVIHFPTFFRVMSNLIKNMSDAHTEEVKIDVELQGEDLVITTKNKIPSVSSHSQNLESKLSQIILEQDQDSYREREKPESLGLASVYFLCQKMGGEYHFEIQNKYWVNTVRIPVKTEGHQDDGVAA